MIYYLTAVINAFICLLIMIDLLQNKNLKMMKKFIFFIFINCILLNLS